MFEAGQFPISVNALDCTLIQAENHAAKQVMLTTVTNPENTMKTSTCRWATALATAAAATLMACGGGGSSSPTATNTGFDVNEFLSVWKFNNGQASGNPAGCNFLGFGINNYGTLFRPSVYTVTTITDTQEVYSDLSCTTYLGLLTTNYSVAWSAGSLPGKSNVARALLTSTGFTISDVQAPGFSLTSPPATGVVYKELLDVEGTLMYNTDFSSPRDADGYPTAVKSPAWYTR